MPPKNNRLLQRGEAICGMQNLTLRVRTCMPYGAERQAAIRRPLIH